ELDQRDSDGDLPWAVQMPTFTDDSETQEKNKTLSFTFLGAFLSVLKRGMSLTNSTLLFTKM
ncbi:MAG: hypothetical protein MPL62_17815, partial [Alphaproteobacteria bacterium]|nr:hypothetical protein [Alphaproteobacteria bacterium]